MINELPFSSPLAAEEYISIDNKVENNEMITEEEIISSFIPVGEEETSENDASYTCRQNYELRLCHVYVMNCVLRHELRLRLLLRLTLN